MTMTTRSGACTAAALAEEAGAVNDLHLSAAQQAKPCLTTGNLRLLLANSGASQLETPQHL